MTHEIINKSLFPNNNCYGCGHDNVNGLKIEIIKDPKNPESLLAEFNAKEFMQGAPGLIHSGSIFTAMDCLATWAALVLTSQPKAIWRTQSSQIHFMGTAYIDQPLLMSAHISQKDWTQNAVIVQVEARNSAGDLVTKAEFSMLPCSQADYKNQTGIDPIPPHWQDFLNS